MLMSNLVFGQGDAPPFVQGQGQTTKSLATVIEVPNNLATKTSSSKTLIESGNKNLLVNPSFEHQTFNTGWTCTGITPIAETTTVVHGKKSMLLAASGSNFECYQDSTLFNLNTTGMQFLASGLIRGPTNLSGTVKVCSGSAGVTSTTNCVTIKNNGAFTRYRVPFVGGATSNRISIVGTGSPTGNIYVDDTEMGPSDVRVGYDSSSVYGTAYWAPILNCQWGQTGSTSSTYADQAADTDCNTPTVTGAASAPATKVPQVNFTTLEPGDYTISANFHAYNSDGSSACWFGLTDENNNIIAEEYVAANSAVSSASIVGYRRVTSVTSNAQFKIRYKRSSGTGSCGLWLDSTSKSGPSNIIVTRVATGNSYSSNNADTDWVPCTFPSLAWQGLGTVTQTIQCKKQGTDLLMRGQFVAGTTTASELRIPLPVWDGANLVSAGLTKIPTLFSAGRMVRSSAAATSSKNLTVLVTAATSYFNASDIHYDIGRNPLVAQNGSTIINTGDTVVLENVRIPIEGWDFTNVTVANISGLESCRDTYECTDSFVAEVSAAGVPVYENIDWINGNCSYASPSFTCPLKTGLAGNGNNLTTGMLCTVSNGGVSGITPNVADAAMANSLTNNIYVNTYNATYTPTAGIFTVRCSKQGADLTGKTAKAVASDQNVRSVGSVGVDIQTVYFGSGATCASPCTTGTCTICGQVGSKITSVTWDSTGAYRLNGLDGTKYFCWGAGFNGSTPAWLPIFHDRPGSTTSYARVGGGTTVTTNAAYVTATCIGIP